MWDLKKACYCSKKKLSYSCELNRRGQELAILIRMTNIGIDIILLAGSKKEIN